MNLIIATDNILKQLSFVIESLQKQEFSRPLLSLNQSTIGQHIRHTIEFFLCLQTGLKNGVVNYDQRNRDLSIEEDPSQAKRALDVIHTFVQQQTTNCDLVLEGSYSDNESDFFSIQSNFYRELAYNLEHAVHHMAIIKIGLTELKPGMELPAYFGVAVSTVRHQRQSVNS